MVELESRLNRARELRAQGHNCAQCVAMVFDDLDAVDSTTISQITAGFGGGVGGQGHICGTISAMAIITGMLHKGAPTDKKEIYSKVRMLSEEFKASNEYMNCIDLKKHGKRSCLELIENAVTIMHNHVAEL